MKRAFVAVVFALVAAAAPARAETKALFEIALDIDRDGKQDRAVLVGGIGSYGPGKDWLMIRADERVDLYIYLGVGDAPLDLARKPSFLKKDIIIGERQNQIFPLEVRNGSLAVKTAYNLYSNWAPETLTIVHRGGDFLVAGFSRDTDMKSGEQGGCDIDFLSGRGVMSKGVDGRKRRLEARFKPVRLAAWSAQSVPKACR